MAGESAINNDIKLGTIESIAKDHARRGIPYFASGPEAKRRLRESRDEQVSPELISQASIQVEDEAQVKNG